MNPSPPSATKRTLAERFAPLTSLQHYDFRLLWSGQFVSMIGSQMRVVAVSWQVYHLAKDTGALDPALALGLIGLAQLVPLLLIAWLSGLVADLVDRRRLLLYTTGASLICSSILALASTFSAVPLWLIYTIITIAAIAVAFEMPARQAVLPTLVPMEHLPNALSLNVITMQLATVLGPSLGGLLIGWSGVALVYWVDTFSYLAVMVAVVLMRRRGAPAATTPVSIHAALEGARFAFRTPIIATIMLLDFFATFFGAAMTLLPLFADRILHVGASQLGLLYAAPSAGAVIAAACLTIAPIRRQGMVLLITTAIFGACTIVFGISRSFPLTLLALAGTGASDTVGMVIRQTIRQILTPNELRGRMAAVGMIFFGGGPQLGELEAGILSSAIGAPLAVALGGGLCIVLVACTAWRVHALRSYKQTLPPMTKIA